MQTELNDQLKHIIYYNPDKKVYERYNNIRDKENKHEEFINVFKLQYGKFDEKDFKVLGCGDDDNDNDDEDHEESNMCVCSHPIKNPWYVTHIETNMTWQIGSRCINKFGCNLDKEMKLIAVKNRNKKKDAICHYCYEPLIDMRKNYQKDGFCNKNCAMKMSYVVAFGKHRGKKLVELMYTKEGRGYIEWIKKELEEDSNAFSRYPLMLEIIEENNIEEEDLLKK
jgi:hypothetical protein